MSCTLKVLISLFPILSLAQNSTHGSSAQAIQISFSDLNKLVSEKNENVKASRVMIEASEARTGHLTRSFLPHVSATAGQEKIGVTSLADAQENYWRLGAQLNLYRGGKDRFEEEAREGQVEFSKVESGRNIGLELKKAQDGYWEIVSLTKLIAFRKEELKQNEDNIRTAGRRAGAGVATNADKLQFELNKAALEQAVEELNIDLDYAKSKLAVVLGLDEHTGIQLKEDFPAISKSLPKTVENKQRLAIKAVQARAKVERARAKANGQWWQPSLDLYASYGVPSLDEEYDRALRQDRETVAGVKLSFDLGQGLNDRSEARAKSLEAKALGHKLAYSAREIEAEQHELEHDMLKTADLVAQTELNVEKAKRFLSLTKTEYQRGVKNGPDLMSASRQFFELNERKIILTRKFLEHRSAIESLNSVVESP